MPAPPTANVSGNYAGTAGLGVEPVGDCVANYFSTSEATAEGAVRQTGSAVNLDVSVVDPPEAGLAPVVCFFDGTFDGSNFQSTLTSCQTPPSRGADPLAMIACGDGSTRQAVATTGTFTGIVGNGRLDGTATVSFDTNNPATGAPGPVVTVTRVVAMTLL